ncbi:hypothetical protein VTI74DRAFT_312 [Chaetomium olivicolor]
MRIPKPSGLSHTLVMGNVGYFHHGSVAAKRHVSDRLELTNPSISVTPTISQRHGRTCTQTRQDDATDLSSRNNQATHLIAKSLHSQHDLHWAVYYLRPRNRVLLGRGNLFAHKSEVRDVVTVKLERLAPPVRVPSVPDDTPGVPTLVGYGHYRARRVASIAACFSC